MLELLKDLMKKPEIGLAGLVKDSKPLFDYVMNQKKHMLVTAEKLSWNVHGKTLDDLTSLVKLER